MSIPVEWLVGPLGGFAFALFVVRELWKLHRDSDKAVIRDRDFWRDRALRSADYTDAAIDAKAKARGG